MPADTPNHRALFGPDQPPLAVPVSCGPCPRIQRQVLAEDDESIT